MVSSKTNPKTPEALIRQEKGASNVLEPFHFEQIECIVDSGRIFCVGDSVGDKAPIRHQWAWSHVIWTYKHLLPWNINNNFRKIFEDHDWKFQQLKMKFFKNFKYLKMNRLNIYSYLTKIQPRSVNTLSIIAILTPQVSVFNSFGEILVIFCRFSTIFGENSGFEVSYEVMKASI